MATPHISAQAGDFAKTVFMPGDPLRAKFIAENFLDDVRLVTQVRGMLGYTGTYHGVPVSVMGSGMGMPSIGIYSYELFTQYGVENIIRIGSAGSYTERAKIFELGLATAAYSESSFAKTQRGWGGDTILPGDGLNDRLGRRAERLEKPLLGGGLHPSDVFYREDKTPYWKALRDEKGCPAVEMESFAFWNSAKLSISAARQPFSSCRAFQERVLSPR